MNKVITSKEAILCVGKQIVIEHGLQGLNIRDVAKKCGVSVGSIYNYFPTKSDLIIETIESVWKEIMLGLTMLQNQNDFRQFIYSLFYDIQKGSQKYSNFFNSHSVSVVSTDKTKGRESMEKYFIYMKKVFLDILNADKMVRSNAFTDTFTKTNFINFVLDNLISLLINKSNSCDFLLEIINRTIY